MEMQDLLHFAPLEPLNDLTKSPTVSKTYQTSHRQKISAIN